MKRWNRRNWLLAVSPALLVLTGVTSAKAEGKHTVDFRLTQWKIMHVDDAIEADTHFKTLKTLGCEVAKNQHTGHIDLKYRATAWKTLSVESDMAAHRWQAYLKKLGFETRHAH